MTVYHCSVGAITEAVLNPTLTLSLWQCVLVACHGTIMYALMTGDMASQGHTVTGTAVGQCHEGPWQCRGNAMKMSTHNNIVHR